MSKKRKKSARKTPEQKQRPTTQAKSASDMLQAFDKPGVIAGFFGILFIALFFLYKPVTMEGKDSQGGDVISNIGNTKQLKAYEEKTGERALWNPYMFSGTPVYHRHNAISWSIDSLLWGRNNLLDWRIWYLFIGALGMFFLIKYLGLSSLSGMMAAVGLVLLPHSHALIVVGHYSKLRALMWMPWIMLSFMMFLKRRDIFTVLLFTLFFALQLRTQHYQIVFYTILLLFAVGIYPYIKLAMAENRSEFLKLNGLFIASILLVVMIVTQPLFITRDYAPHSTRGGNAVTLENAPGQQDKKGVGFDYATNWSYSVSEFWNLIVPKFHGGTSSELYTGSAVPQLRNQVIPTYWGDLPFTQSYEYLGVLVAFLVLLGIVFQWDRAEVKALTALMVFALLLSLGKNFAPLYKLFFYYVPYFDKFRVPMMILTLVSFSSFILAAYGLNYITTGRLKEKKDQQIFYMLGGLYFVILLIPILFGGSFALSPEGEVQRYAGQYGQQAPQLVSMLKQARLEILSDSARAAMIVFVLGAGLLFVAIRSPENGWLIGSGIIILIVLDLGSVTTGYLKDKFVDLKSIEQRSYQETPLDRQVKKDTGLYRVLPPLSRVLSDSRYTYHYQSIGGYSAAKLQVIQDVLSNILIDRTNRRFPINLNIVSMLNGKYIFAEAPYSDSLLEHLGSQGQQLHLFRNKAVLPRAWFVEKTRQIDDGVARLTYMKSKAFSPASEALLEKPLAADVSPPQNSSVVVSEFSPDRMVIETQNDNQSLLVISEIYYPAGWTATLADGQSLEIYKTNHLLRSVIVPAGKQQITLRFEPAYYHSGVTVSWIGWLIVYAGLGFFLYRRYSEK